MPANILLSIESDAAAEAYPFELSAAEEMELDLLDDGSVEIWLGGEAVGSISSPWAYDANGAPVSTYFTVESGTLTQHVEHVGKGHSYPIIADPDWWWYTKKIAGCISAVAGIGAVGLTATRVTVAITKALSKAKAGTSLHKAYQAWKELGKLDGAPFKTLLGVIKSYFVTLGKNIGKGFTSAAVAAKNEISKGKRARVLAGLAFLGAMDLISDVTGLTDCRSVVTGK